MKIAVLGTGMVGEAIASRLSSLGHDVMMGSRDVNNEKAKAWSEQAGSTAGYGDFKAAANFSEGLVFNCTKGEHALNALNLAGSESLIGKTIVDISNPLDFSNGMPPTLSICNDNSLAEEIQKAFPESYVVKTLNTMNAQIMLNPSTISGDHTVFVSGNDTASKEAVMGVLKECGWKSANIIDLGDITTARGTEMLLPVWIRLWGALGTADFNFHIQRN